MSRFIGFVLFSGCGSAELLPLIDADGALAGTYDPAGSSLSVDFDAASAELSTGEVAQLDAGAAFVEGLSPGDQVALFDAAGEPVAVLEVAEPDAPLSEEDASSRYAGCERVNDGVN
ncbi:MAG: hypothetical protein ABMA64_14210 [Myxococcota bacterium]